MPLQEKGKYWVTIKEVGWISTRRAKFSFVFEIVPSPSTKRKHRQDGKAVVIGIYIGGNCQQLLQELTTLKRHSTTDHIDGKYILKDEQQYYKITQKSRYDFRMESEDGSFLWDNSINTPPASILIIDH